MCVIVCACQNCQDTQVCKKTLFQSCRILNLTRHQKAQFVYPKHMFLLLHRFFSCSRIFFLKFLRSFLHKMRGQSQPQAEAEAAAETADTAVTDDKGEGGAAYRVIVIDSWRMAVVGFLFWLFLGNLLVAP